MAKVDPQDRLGEGWDPAPVPPMSPDLHFPPSPRLAPLGPEPPTLCEQGPCIHYHVMQIRLDAAKPIDGSQTPERKYTTKTCYPHAGIEVDLNDTPVFQCNRWLPADATREGRHRVIATRDFMLSKPGEEYQAELAKWEADQQKLRDEETAVQAEAVAEIIEKTPNDLIERMRQLHGSPDLPLHTGIPEITDDANASMSCPPDCPRCELQRRAMQEEFE